LRCDTARRHRAISGGARIAAKKDEDLGRVEICRRMQRLMREFALRDVIEGNHDQREATQKIDAR
jgi:hypothetical protein